MYSGAFSQRRLHNGHVVLIGSLRWSSDNTKNKLTVGQGLKQKQATFFYFAAPRILKRNQQLQF